MSIQEDEIKTIKERVLKINLSDADCERISEKCGLHGLTVGELFENFIGDLVGGTYTNGSDERDLADRYFDRCWFGAFPKNTLLHHLLECGYKPDEYIEILDNIETAENEKKYAQEHPEEFNEEELSDLNDDIESWNEQIRDMLEDWKPDSEPNMLEEILAIKKWINDRKSLLGTYKDE